MTKQVVCNRLALVEFALNSNMVANFQVLGKFVREIAADIPKGCYDALNVSNLVKLTETMRANRQAVKSNNPAAVTSFADLLDSFTRWVQRAKEVANGMSEDDFITPRGRDYSTVKVSLFGVEAYVAEHVMSLLAGSKLGELLEGYPGGNSPESANALKIVLGQIRKTLYEACEIEQLATKTARKRKAKDDSPESGSEPVEDESGDDYDDEDYEDNDSDDDDDDTE